MMFATYIVVFCALLFILSKTFKFNAVDLMVNMTLRLLSGIVIISFFNFIVYLSGGNLYVNINEISSAVSAILGISGTFFLIAFQWILTIM